MPSFASEHLGALVGILAALAAVVAFVRGWFLGYPRAALENSILSAKEQAIIAACSDALLPPGGSPRLSGSEAGAVAYFDATLREVPPRQRLLLRLMLRFLEHGPWIFSFERRLTRQSLERRTLTMERWRTSRLYFLRAVFTSARMLLAMAYLAHPDVRADLGARGNLDPFDTASARAVSRETEDVGP